MTAKSKTGDELATRGLGAQAGETEKIAELGLADLVGSGLRTLTFHNQQGDEKQQSKD